MTQDSNSRCSAQDYHASLISPLDPIPDSLGPTSPNASAMPPSRLPSLASPSPRLAKEGPRAMMRFNQAVELMVTQLGTVLPRGWPGGSWLEVNPHDLRCLPLQHDACSSACRAFTSGPPTTTQHTKWMSMRNSPMRALVTLSWSISLLLNAKRWSPGLLIGKLFTHWWSFRVNSSFLLKCTYMRNMAPLYKFSLVTALPRY